ncbi:MAG: AEC family transporter [Brevinematia bacterium]
MFLKVIFPVFIVILVSYLFSKFKKVDPFNLSVLSMYILTPGLILRSFDMYGNFLLSNSFKSIVHLGLEISAMYFISIILANTLKLSYRSKYAFILLSFLPNTGNIGIPVCEYYLGTQGSSFATLILVITSIVSQTYGVYLASKGKINSGDSIVDLKNAFINILSLPLIYVVLVSIIMTIFSIKLPFYLRDPIYNIGISALIIGLIQLGIVLGKVRLSFVPLRFVIFVVVLKLVVSPIISLGIGYFLGFRNVELKVLVLQYGMPSALYCSILANFFNLLPRTVGVSVLVSTFLSAFTLYGIIELMELL